MFGELGVIFNIPQPFTMRSKRLSQVIRISHHHFKQLLQPFSEDGKIILSNFLQVEISKTSIFHAIIVWNWQLALHFFLFLFLLFFFIFNFLNFIFWVHVLLLKAKNFRKIVSKLSPHKFLCIIFHQHATKRKYSFIGFTHCSIWKSSERRS